MKLKQPQERSLLVTFGSKMIRERKYLILGIACYTVLIFAAGILLHRSGFFHQKVSPVLQQNFRLLPKIIEGALADAPRIMIDIKHTDFQRLAYQREQAMQSGILIKSEEDYVPARIRLEDKIVKAKLRLKGDWTDHLEGEKWSYRVVVKGENSIFGMKTFSIQHPKTRNYLGEWLFHKLLKHEGLIGLRYDFLNVTINGKDYGVYALEEHFEKRLIESNELREGPIVKFNENMLWQERAQQRIDFPHAEMNGSGTYLASDVDGFQTSKWLADPARRPLYQKAIYLLEAFRRGALEPSQVFDVDKMGKFLAIVDLVGGKHAAIWHNFRFYYNPVTSRLEPIGFDADCGHMIEGLLVHDTRNPDLEPETDGVSDYKHRLFADPSLYKVYMRALERIARPAYLDEFFADVDAEMRQKLAILYQEFPTYDPPIDTLYSNQRYIRTVLNPAKALHAYFRIQQGAELLLDIGNIQRLPLEILDVTYKDSVSFLLPQPAVLAGRIPGHLVDFKPIRFPIPAGFAWADSMRDSLRVHYRLLGTSKTRSEAVFPYRFIDEVSLKTDALRQAPNAEQFPFCRFDPGERRITILSGEWQVSKNLIFPAGYTIYCNGPTTLNLTNRALILSYSPFRFQGTAEQPILISSSDSSGQGLAVMSAGGPSQFDYVHFDNLSNPAHGDWVLTGAVTFYESPVAFFHCTFSNNRSEDALNIIRTTYTIASSRFVGTQSDAFDADFADGEITDTSFIHLGNDGIDVSGSEVRIERVFIDRAGDKGVSAGENSHVVVTQAVVQNSEIGLTSKDLSLLELSSAKVLNCKVGFTAFQKKAEFGPAKIRVRDLELTGAKIAYLIEENSEMTVDGQPIPPSRKNVQEILYGVEYGKSSK